MESFGTSSKDLQEEEQDGHEGQLHGTFQPPLLGWRLGSESSDTLRRGKMAAAAAKVSGPALGWGYTSTPGPQASGPYPAPGHRDPGLFHILGKTLRLSLPCPGPGIAAPTSPTTSGTLPVC